MQDPDVVETTINKSPVLKPLYANLVKELQRIGPIVVEPKKTPVHIK